MKIYEIFMIALAILLFVTGLSFAIDRELARRDFVKAVHNKDFEQPISGCIFDNNCKYYTNLLYDVEVEDE